MNVVPMNKTRCELARRFAFRAREIAAEVRGTDVGVGEEPDAGEMRTVVMARTIALTGETVVLLSAALDAFEDESEDAQEIPAVAAIARMTLREKEELLRRIDPEGDPWEVVDRCDRALRAVSKALVALEHALASGCGFEPCIAIVDECTRGLRVRTVYAKFRLAVLHIDERQDSVTARIRAGATALAILTGREEYPLIRVSDRRQLRTLQQRARAWLSDGASIESDGAHLWEELLAVSSLLLQINRRAEIVAHDDRELRELCSALRFRGASAESVWPRILSLRGLDLQLDRMIESPHDLGPAAWAREICRLAAERTGDAADAATDAWKPTFESQLAAQVRG